MISNFEFFFLTAGQAGAVDEESFIQAFEDVKKINIFNGRSVTEELNKIKEILTKTSNDWKLRMETCGNMRALLLAGAAQYDELFMGLKTLEVAFQNSVKDLRSQVKKRMLFLMQLQLLGIFVSFLKILLFFRLCERHV